MKWFELAFGFGWPRIAEKLVRNYVSFLRKIMLGKSITMNSPGTFSIFAQLGSPCLLHIHIRSWCFCIIILPMFQNGCFIQNCNVWCVYLSNKIRVIELSGRRFRLLKTNPGKRTVIYASDSLHIKLFQHNSLSVCLTVGLDLMI